MLLLAWYRAYEFRYFAEVTRFGSVRFSSGLKARHVIRIYGLYYVVLGVLSAAIAGVVMVFFFGLGSSLLAGMGQTSPEALATYLNMAMIVVFLVALLFGSALLSLLNPVLIVHPLLKKVVASIKFRGHYNVEDLLQSAKAAESRGEGLADAFDVEVAGF